MSEALLTWQLGVACGKDIERERIIALLREAFGEDYYEMGICGRIVALIRAEEVAE